ncbi:Putative 28S rRNA (cytosine-C(5))-methyltransferase [Ancistrocladus abbreviatus]
MGRFEAREKPPVRGGREGNKLTERRLSNGERSAYFARREAAKVLRTVLQGDARRRAVASIKSLVYGPAVRNKKATFALVCQTLKYLPLIKDVLEAAGVLNSKWKRQEELMYIITYDILFGKEMPSYGTAEKYLLPREGALQSTLARLLVKMKVKRVEDLPSIYQTPDVSKPRYVRVNTLKLDVESALLEFGKQYTVQKDDMVPNLLILPPGTDLHDHPLVTSGRVLLQGKASSMVAVALEPQAGWEVLDACSAPGNKTVHLSALMGGKGKIIACELNIERVKRLMNTIRMAGATNVEVLHGDFLDINIDDPKYSKIRAILLDPSCSGSGTFSERLDHLLPSSMKSHTTDVDMTRLTKLAAFQKRALEHALSFPSVERIAYSTCSIHQIENEDVIRSVLPLASSYGFHLATLFPQWPRRGFPIFVGAEHLVRMDPVEDKEGFFIALFVRERNCPGGTSRTSTASSLEVENPSMHKRPLHNQKLRPFLSTKISRIWLHPSLPCKSRNLKRKHNEQ